MAPGNEAIPEVPAARSGASEVDIHFMRQALEAAAAGGGEGEVPVGAVVVAEGGTLLGRAHNSPRGLCDPTAHAEVLALRQAAAALQNYRLPGATLYVTLEPCAMCVGAMIQARIGRLVFGAADPKAGAAVSLYRLAEDGRLNHQIEVTGGVLAEEAAALLREFFERLR